MSTSKSKHSDNKYHQLEKLAEYLHFPAAKTGLLELALTHSTFFEGSRHGGNCSVGDDNQRLEFLGDAVLDLIVGERLYQLYPAAREGELSKMRAYLVCEASLAEAAQKLGLDACLRMGRGAEAGGDRHRPSVQADAYEAVTGAIFLAMGYDKTREFIIDQLGPAMEKLSPLDYEDKKSLLQEIIQSKAPYGVTYRVLERSGPDHKPHFRSGVYCGKLLLAEGEGGSKKESEVAAAAKALQDKENWLDKIG